MLTIHCTKGGRLTYLQCTLIGQETHQPSFKWQRKGFWGGFPDGHASSLPSWEQPTWPLWLSPASTFMEDTTRAIWSPSSLCLPWAEILPSWPEALPESLYPWDPLSPTLSLLVHPASRNCPKQVSWSHVWGVTALIKPEGNRDLLGVERGDAWHASVLLRDPPMSFHRPQEHSGKRAQHQGGKRWARYQFFHPRQVWDGSTAPRRSRAWLWRRLPWLHILHHPLTSSLALGKSLTSQSPFPPLQKGNWTQLLWVPLLLCFLRKRGVDSLVSSLWFFPTSACYWMDSIPKGKLSKRILKVVPWADHRNRCEDSFLNHLYCVQGINNCWNASLNPSLKIKNNLSFRKQCRSILFFNFNGGAQCGLELMTPKTKTWEDLNSLGSCMPLPCKTLIHWGPWRQSNTSQV